MEPHIVEDYELACSAINVANMYVAGAPRRPED